MSGSRGYFSITVKNDGGKVSRKATFKKGPEPKPDLKRGEDLFSEMESYMYDGLAGRNQGYFIDVPGTDYKVFYDMWSNVHYGYVGRAAGFDSKTLI
ncbi:polymorphic toxin type 44 domain-containing protein [Streptomyces sp. NPDC127039]|uniref:polymorphic toxin type 44 domain-containing protein n=1 Tax=Streptomyces sp. NPDC127039 TaxID=3347115 RepID=UPI0036653593